MSPKGKNNPGVPLVERQKGTERQKEIERLEKDVEELRRLAGDDEADAGLERIGRVPTISAAMVISLPFRCPST